MRDILVGVGAAQAKNLARPEVAGRGAGEILRYRSELVILLAQGYRRLMKQYCAPLHVVARVFGGTVL